MPDRDNGVRRGDYSGRLSCTSHMHLPSRSEEEDQRVAQGKGPLFARHLTVIPSIKSVNERGGIVKKVLPFALRDIVESVSQFSMEVPPEGDLRSEQGMDVPVTGEIGESIMGIGSMRKNKGSFLSILGTPSYIRALSDGDEHVGG